MSYLGIRQEDAPHVPLYITKGEKFYAAVELDTTAEDKNEWTFDLDIRNKVTDADPLIQLALGSGLTISDDYSTLYIEIEGAVTGTLNPAHRLVYAMRAILPDGRSLLIIRGPVRVEQWVAR